MPLVVAPLVALSLGLGFGLVTLGSRGARGFLLCRSSVRAFALFALFPALLFSALLRPEWAALHFAGERVPSAALLAGAALSAYLVPLAHDRAPALAVLPRPRAFALAALPGALALLVLFMLHRRTLTLTQGVRGLAEAEPLFGSATGAAFILIDALLLAAVILTAGAVIHSDDASEKKLGKLSPPRSSDAPGALRRRKARALP